MQLLLTISPNNYARIPYTPHHLTSFSPSAMLPRALQAVLQNDLVDDLTADDASPPKKVFAIPIKLFINHYPIAPIAPHETSLLERMDLRTDSNLNSTVLEVLPFQSLASPSLHNLSFHRLYFIQRSRRVNRVNPVFQGGKHCIFVE